MSYAIEAAGLRKSFQDHEAVKGIHLQVNKGELFALLGPNGAGKTTTVHMLSTLLKPDGGSARVAGYDVVGSAGEVRKRISLTGQFAAVDESLTGMQNIVLMAKLYGYSTKEARAIAERLISAFGLWEAKDRTADTYSGGMRRRLDIAAGIVSPPEILFLDEPTTGLDPRSRMEVWEVVRMLLDRRTTVLLTTQYLEEADRLADRIAVIDQGEIAAEGTPGSLKASIGAKSLQIRLAEHADREGFRRLLADHLQLTALQDDEAGVYRIPVRDAEHAGQAMHALTSHQVAMDGFSLSEPSLDEAFLAITSASRPKKEAAV